MAKNSKFWEESKLDLIPFFGCMAFLAVLGGVYLGLDKYNLAKYENKQKQIQEAKAAMDSINAVKDTIALTAVKNIKR